jgi:hypothetical protein
MSPIYQKLAKRHIRLLHLQSGKASDPLHGQLRHVCIDNTDTLAYEALSYTWGTPGAAPILRCEGSDVGLPLTANLTVALSRLRFLDRGRVLWVDQICINQDDLVKRAQQVSLTGKIYRGAEFVDI